VAQQEPHGGHKHHHGPIVTSINESQFELMQNISDMLTTKTAFDQYVDQKTGQINSD
jgi:hypothetical protein